MRLTVNGETMQVGAADLADLLRELEYEGTHFAIAVNHGVVPRARWIGTRLNEGDEIEILSPRQGG
jgi:sulfur carrier protein